MFVDKGNHTVSHIWCSDLPVVVGLSPAGRVSHPPPHRASLLVDCCAAAPHRGPPRKQRALSSTAEAPARRHCSQRRGLVLCFARLHTWVA
uniref:Groucho n=1 Tax=Rhipicephalus appendiculatus TaxID=34631 RepID=A0A131Z318_RHIAP